MRLFSGIVDINTLPLLAGSFLASPAPRSARYSEYHHRLQLNIFPSWNSFLNQKITDFDAEENLAELAIESDFQ
jgi:hypothetical protein